MTYLGFLCSYGSFRSLHLRRLCPCGSFRSLHLGFLCSCGSFRSLHLLELELSAFILCGDQGDTEYCKKYEDVDTLVMKRDKGIMSLSKGDILTSNRIRHFAPWRKSFGPIVDDYYRWESEAWSQEKKMSKVRLNAIGLAVRRILESVLVRYVAKRSLERYCSPREPAISFGRYCTDSPQSSCCLSPIQQLFHHLLQYTSDS